MEAFSGVALPLVIRVVHFFAAFVWIGGSLFIFLVLEPSLRKVDRPSRVAVASRVIPRFNRLVMFFAWPTVIATGALLGQLTGGDLANTAYWASLGGLVLLGGISFVLLDIFVDLTAMRVIDKIGKLEAGLLSGGNSAPTPTSPGEEDLARYQRRLRFWLIVDNCVAAPGILVFMALLHHF